MNKIVLRVNVVLALIAVGLTLAGCGYNTIPTLQEQAKARWADVENQYQRRACATDISCGDCVPPQK